MDFNQHIKPKDLRESDTTTMMYDKGSLGFPKRFLSFKADKDSENQREKKQKREGESTAGKLPFSKSLSHGSSKGAKEFSYLDLKPLYKVPPLNEKTQEIIRVLSYNLLADSFLYRNDGSTWYPYTNPKYLETSFRYSLMTTQINVYDADIICLQEVDKLKEHFGPKLLDMNYEFIQKNKAEKPDFLIIGWKKNKFEIVSQDSIVFRDCLPEALKNEPDFQKGDIAVIAHLRSLASKKSFCVINAHLFWNHRKEAVQYFQASLIKQYILKNLATSDKLVLCGDFNSFPFSNVFRLICFDSEPSISFSRDKDYYDEKQMNYLYDLLVKPHLKEMKIYSAYGLYSFDKFKNKHRHPQHTQFSRSANGCVDYIFYNDKSRMKIVNLLNMPPFDILTEEEAIPNRLFPSDHLPIMAEFLSE